MSGTERQHEHQTQAQEGLGAKAYQDWHSHPDYVCTIIIIVLVLLTVGIARTIT